MEKSLREQLGEIEERVNNMEGLKNAPKQSLTDKITGKKKIKKEFKMPRNVKMGSQKKIKENYVLVVYLRSNRHAEFKWSPIVDDSVYVQQTDLWYPAVGGCIFQYKKFPMVVIPEWNLSPITNKPIPFDPIEDVNKIENGEAFSSYPQKILVHLLKKQALSIKDKKQIKGKALLLVVIVIGIVIYLGSKLIS